MTISKSYWRVGLIIFFVGVFAFLLWHALKLLTASPPDPWIIGDWLINYQGGIVRRGFAGELFFRLAQIANLSPVLLVVAFQVLMYLVFLINACRLAVHSSFSALNAAIIFSPAFILFPALDPLGAFRKEIIIFALYSMVCWRLASSKTVSGRMLALIGAASVLIVLSHEMLVIFLPYLIYPFILYEGGVGTKTKQVALALLPAFTAAIFLIAFNKPDAQVVDAVCRSLQAYAPEDCISAGETMGAISFLQQDVAAAHEFVLNSTSTDAVVAQFLVAILSFLPVSLTLLIKRRAVDPNKNAQFWLTIGIFAAILGSLPLLWVMADYGRIIYLHTVFLSMLALMMTQDRGNTALQLDRNQVIAWVAAFAFVINWRLYHWKTSLGYSFPLLKIMYEILFKG